MVTDLLLDLLELLIVGIFSLFPTFALPGWATAGGAITTGLSGLAGLLNNMPGFVPIPLMVITTLTVLGVIGIALVLGVLMWAWSKVPWVGK